MEVERVYLHGITRQDLDEVRCMYTCIHAIATLEIELIYTREGERWFSDVSILPRTVYINTSAGRGSR